MGKKFVFFRKIISQKLPIYPILPFIKTRSVAEWTANLLFAFSYMIFNTGLTEHMITPVYILLYDLQYRTYRTHEHNCIHFIV